MTSQLRRKHRTTVSKKLWEARFTKLAAGLACRWQRTLATGLTALPLAAGLLLGSVAEADQSILVRNETSATSIATVPAQPVSAAKEHVNSSFQQGAHRLSAGDNTDSIKLKWRARHPNSFMLNGAKHDSAVQQATQLTELNDASPFNDPFNDRTQSRFTSTVKSQDPDNGAFRELTPPPPANNFEDAPKFSQPAPGESLLSPSRNGCTDCPDKCYKGRNCCDELEKCATAQQLIREYDIKNISLDITPSIKPGFFQSDSISPEELGAYKSQQLFQAKSRVWRDADGKELVNGSLVDFSNDSVFIATANGDTKRYRFGILSDDDRCFVSAWWNIPAACKLGNERFVGRYHTPITMTWTASQVCHKPLYFEEIALERYGHTAGPLVQPWISGAHFFTNIAFLPYKMGINPMGECQYDLGYYRPGNCAPWMISPIPLSARGALFQAGAITGVNYLIP